MGRTFHHSLTFAFRPAAVLIGWLLSGIFARAGPGTPAIPPGLSTRLQQEKSKDDLQDWVYDQIQWVATHPSARALQLEIVLRTAWRAPRTAEEHQAWLDLLINQGYALLQAGDIVASTDAYSAALDWARSHRAVADSALVLNTILKPLGNNYTRLGDYEEADFIQQQALGIAATLQDRASLAGAYGNLANTAASRGDPEKSLEYCRLGLQEIPDRSPYRGLLLSEEADALSAIKEAPAARRSISQAIAILRASRRNMTRMGNRRSGPSAAALDNWLFVACRQAGDIDSGNARSALHHYNEAIQIAGGTGNQHTAVNRRELAKLFLRLGEWYQRDNQPAAAIRNLDESLSALVPGKKFAALTPEDLYPENTLADVLYTRAMLAAGDPAFAYRCYRLSFLTEGLMRRQFITGVSRERAVADSRSRHESAIQAAWAEWTRSGSHAALAAILEFMESSKAQLLLDELLQQQRLGINTVATDSLYRRVRMLEQALIYYQEQGLQNAGHDSLSSAILARRRQTERDLASSLKSVPGTNLSTTLYSDGSPDYLPGDSTEIRSFFAGAHALYQIGVNQKGIAFAEREPLGGAWEDSLRRFLRTWFGLGPANMIDHPRAYFDQGYAIWEDIFGAHPLAPHRHYIIIPDGAMDLLPVDALPCLATYSPSPAHWPLALHESCISYAWSIATLKLASRPSGNQHGFAGFFIGEGHRGEVALGAVRKEQEGISQSMRGGTFFDDDEATASAFQTALQQSAVVHVSSHASSRTDRTHAPAIELYDHPYYIFQLSTLPRHPALVVLSACRTGDGKRIVGEGIQSMARAFTGAGTNGVIAGWWDVHDEAAARLTTIFYRNLRSGETPAGALRHAKESWLEDPSVPYLEKLPWYWAALNYQGAVAPLPGTLFLPRAENSNSWLFAAGFGLLTVGLMILIRYRNKKNRSGRER